MKIRIVKPNSTCWHHGGMAEGSYYESDTIEINLDDDELFLFILDGIKDFIQSKLDGVK